ncbi:MAG: ABC transporter ATP-binding protein [Chitinophagales bacterium]|nr:ABC transporter ATP-binding protein [Chitinophagales bacterium]
MKNRIEEKEFERKDALWPFLKRLFGLVRKNYPRYFWALLASVAVVAIADASFPLIWKSFIDDVLSPNLQALQIGQLNGETWIFNASIFMHIAWQFIAWMLVMAAGVLVFIWCAENVKERVIYDLRKMMFNRLQHLSYSFYDKNSTGWLVSRITSDADRVTELISWGFVSVVWGVAMVFVSFGYMFMLNWQLALGVFASMPLLLYVAMKIRTLILEYSRKARKKNSEMIAYVTEHINGVEVNKASVQEQSAIEGYKEHTKAMRNYAFKSSFYTAMYMPLVFLTGSIAAAFVILMGGHLSIAAYGLSLGTWAAFFGYSRFIFEPIFDISRFYALAQDSLSAGERIFALIDEKQDIDDSKAEGEFSNLKGEIEFKDVDFYYSPSKPILQGFNLKIKAGESVALVGPTGHGKTTLTALIGRFYEPQAGELRMDGVDYTKRTLNSFRKQLGVVLQSPFLFSGSLKDNILFSLRGEQASMPSDEELIGILKRIGAEDLVAKLNEEVGEEGLNLSNGERQLVSFARAIIKDPAILIMDEATSSIDTLTEAKIQQGIAEIIKNRTSIIIAHRLSTIKNCDRIIVIEHGKIKEMGTHQELIELKGHYYNLYLKQARRVLVK